MKGLFVWALLVFGFGISWVWIFEVTDCLRFVRARIQFRVQGLESFV